jgi:DNA repair ATPase RecN
MLQINHSLAYPMIGLLIIFLTTACNDSKVTQCNRFAQVNEKIRVSLAKHEAEGKTLSQKHTTDLAGLKALAKDFSSFYSNSAQDIDKALKLIDELNVQDEKLQSFKREYADITKQAGESFRQLSQNATAQSAATVADLTNGKLQQLRQEFKQASNGLAASGKKEQELMDKFNVYCGSSKK